MKVELTLIHSFTQISNTPVTRYLNKHDICFVCSVNLQQSWQLFVSVRKEEGIAYLNYTVGFVS